jgi:hypothetical protein
MINYPCTFPRSIIILNDVDDINDVDDDDVYLIENYNMAVEYKISIWNQLVRNEINQKAIFMTRNI